MLLCNWKSLGFQCQVTMACLCNNVFHACRTLLQGSSVVGPHTSCWFLLASGHKVTSHCEQATLLGKLELTRENRRQSNICLFCSASFLSSGVASHAQECFSQPESAIYLCKNGGSLSFLMLLTFELPWIVCTTCLVLSLLYVQNYTCPVHKML